MSAIQLLEKIGADASLKNKEIISKEEIQNLLDTCPDIICFFVPAEDEKDSEDEDDKKEDKIDIASGF